MKRRKASFCLLVSLVGGGLVGLGWLGRGLGGGGGSTPYLPTPPRLLSPATTTFPACLLSVHAFLLLPYPYSPAYLPAFSFSLILPMPAIYWFLLWFGFLYHSPPCPAFLFSPTYLPLFFCIALLAFYWQKDMSEKEKKKEEKER